MRIQDLIKPISEMSDEELLEHVRGIRHRRETIRPAAAKRVERAEKKVTKAKVSKVTKVVDTLSDADRLKLIALLQEET